MATLTVGQGQQYSTIKAAVAASHVSSTSGTPPKTTEPITPTGPTSPGAPAEPTTTAGITWTGNRSANSKTGTEGDDHFYGQGGNDRLLGLAGADTLEGQWGRDTLVGGTGNDLLIGGGGDDVFKLESHGGADRIQGFANHNYVGEHDHIDVTSLGVTKANFASMVSITDSADGALIKVGDTQVTVLGMHASSFNSSDFLLG